MLVLRGHNIRSVSGMSVGSMIGALTTKLIGRGQSERAGLDRRRLQRDWRRRAIAAGAGGVQLQNATA